MRDKPIDENEVTGVPRNVFTLPSSEPMVFNLETGLEARIGL